MIAKENGVGRFRGNERQTPLGSNIILSNLGCRYTSCLFSSTSHFLIDMRHENLGLKNRGVVIGEEYGLEFRIVKNEEWITPMYQLTIH